MSHLSFLFIVCWYTLPGLAQARWDGGGGTSAWNDASNWEGDILPEPGEAVILDHTFIPGNYEVTLPDQVIVVRRIEIGTGVELLLPATNTSVPGFTVGQLVILNGGIFRNASGASAGTPLQVTDSIIIQNGGKFIHNTPRGHAANVDRLSRAPGTEKGILEFDIPAASTTLSLSGRTYGTLILNSVAAGGSLSCTAAGTNTLNIRGDFVIHDGVSLHLNFSDTISVAGDLLQGNALLNLGSTARNLVFAIKGSIVQANSGVITETGTGMQEIVLTNEQPQLLVVHGLTQNITVVKDGVGSTSLGASFSLPYRLVLRKGKFITGEHLLTLQADCDMLADSLELNSYVDGHLRKEGMANGYCFFPVGGSAGMRWLALDNATGDFTVSYIRGNPAYLSSKTGEGIHHISQLEYWNIRGGGDASAVVKLSFSDPHSGGVTSLGDLRVLRLTADTWVSVGNAGVGGAPGSNGWVSSFAASGFSAENNFFALASANGLENPLPFIERPRLRPERINENRIQLMNTVSVTNFLNIRISGTESRRLRFTIFNAQGNTVKKFFLDVAKGSSNLKLSVDGLRPGVYFLSMIDNFKDVITWKFIKR